MMEWLKLYSVSAFHPRVLAAGNAATGAWFRMMAFVGLSDRDGTISRSQARIIATENELRKLLKVGLLLEDAEQPDVLVFKNWERYQEGWEAKRPRKSSPEVTTEEAARKAEIARENGKKGGRPRKTENPGTETQKPTLVSDGFSDSEAETQNNPLEEEEEENRGEEGAGFPPSVLKTEPQPVSVAPITTAPSAVRPVVDRDPPPLSSRAPDPMIGAMFSEAVRAVTGAPHVVTNSFVWRDLGAALYAHFPELTGGQHGAELRRLVPEWIAADRAGDGFAGKGGYQPKPFINWLNARAAAESAPEPPSRYKALVDPKWGPGEEPPPEALALYSDFQGRR